MSDLRLSTQYIGKAFGVAGKRPVHRTMTQYIEYTLDVDLTKAQYWRVNKNQHNALYNSYAQMKALIKRDSITLATKHVA